MTHLPCKAHILLRNALSASQATFQKHDGHHGGLFFQARNAGVPFRLMGLLFLSCQHELLIFVFLVRVEFHDVQVVAIGAPFVQTLVKPYQLFVLGYAEQKVTRPLFRKSAEKEGEIVFATDVTERIDLMNVTVFVVVLGAIVAWTRAHHHTSLLSTVSTNDGGFLCMRRGRDGEDVGFVADHVFGRARHGETVSAEKEAQRLILFGHHMRFVHHDQGAVRVHRVLFEVLAEDDADLLLVFGGVLFFDVLVTLAAEFGFMRSTQDVGAINEASLHHRPNDAMIGTRFARLDIGAEENIANERQKDRERGEGRFGLLGEHVGGQ